MCYLVNFLFVVISAVSILFGSGLLNFRNIVNFFNSNNKKQLFRQSICVHKWTSAALENVPPTVDQLSSLDGFYDYAKLYCKRCNKISYLNGR